MTAVLAAAGRAVLGAVLLLAVVAAVLWAYGRAAGAWPLVAWLRGGVRDRGARGAGVSALQPKGDGDG